MTSATTEHTRPKTTKRGTRGRPDRPSRHGRGWSASAERAERSEALLLEAARTAADPGTRDAYVRRFRARLLEEVDRLGSPDAHVLGVAYSRAALTTWSGSGLHPFDAEAVRLEVAEEVRDSLGVERVSLPAVDFADREERDEEDLRVPPRVRARADRVRRSGRR